MALNKIWEYIRNLKLLSLGGLTILGVSLLTVNFYCGSDPPECPEPPPITKGVPSDPGGYDRAEGCTEAGCVDVLIPSMRVLQDQFWVVGSQTDLEAGPLSMSFADGVRSASFYKVATAVVAVGMSSEEGDLQSQWTLALRRGHTMSDVLKQRIDKELYILTLGRFMLPTEAGTEHTFNQRRALVLGLIVPDPSMTTGDIEAAMQKALDERYNFGFKSGDYDDFVLNDSY